MTDKTSENADTSLHAEHYDVEAAVVLARSLVVSGGHPVLEENLRNVEALADEKERLALLVGRKAESAAIYKAALVKIADANRGMRASVIARDALKEVRRDL